MPECRVVVEDVLKTNKAYSLLNYSVSEPKAKKSKHKHHNKEMGETIGSEFELSGGTL